MNRKITHALSSLVFVLAAYMMPAQAEIQGISGSAAGNVRTFDLIAAPFHISTPDGARILVWGYGPAGGVPQYPGPTLIADQGDDIVVNVSNSLGYATSIVFPGQAVQAATGDATGLLTAEAAAIAGTTPGMATYEFTATHEGTYQYHSGTQQALQVEMGLVGALIIRPAASSLTRAYNDAATSFDHEYLFLLTEMDPQIHLLMEFNLIDAVDMTAYRAMLWFINGRPAPDSMAPDNVDWLPNQPYGSMARTHPGEVVLMRLVGASRTGHPFHAHGNHFKQIARDGRMMQTAPGVGADLGLEDFTMNVSPGSTSDALWSWTGDELGWDIYGGIDEGHSTDPLWCDANDGNGDGYHDITFEYCADHTKAFPVVLPELQDLTFGGFYSGSPFLGVSGDLPPGEGGLNLNGGLFFMWHSHNAREQVNFDVPPGGMTTMMIVEPHGVPIP